MILLINIKIMEQILSSKKFLSKILNHKGLKRYGFNTGWMFIGKIFNLLISFFVAILVIRHLGPENYGIVSYVLGFVTLFSIIARTGVDGIIYRDLIDRPEERNSLLGSSLVIKSIASLTTILIGVFIAIWVEGFSQTSLFIFILFLSFIFKPSEIFRNYFQSEIKGKIISIIEIISKIITALMFFFGVLFNLPLIFFISVYAIDWSIPVIGLAFIYHKENSLKKLTYSKDSIKKIFIESLPLLLNGILATILAKTDIIMVRNILGDGQTGFYSAAVRLSEFWYVIPTLIISSFFPAIVRSYKRDSNEYKRRAGYLTSLIVGMSLVISILFTLFSEQIVKIILGKEFMVANSVLSLYIWSSIGMGITLILKRDLLIKKKVKQIFIFSLVSVIVNLILNFSLIPIYGINGAAIATLISSFVFGFLFTIFFFFKPALQNKICYSSRD